MPSSMTLQVAVATADEIAREVLAPNAERIDRNAEWPEDGIRALQAAGLGGLVAPVDAGGLGAGLVGLTQVCEALGKACPSTALCFGMHAVGTATIAAKATPDQRKRFLEPIVAGHHLTTLSLSEPGSGAHFYFPHTTLKRLDNDVLEVSGTKTFVTNGGHADSYVVSTMAADPEAPIGQFSVLLVPNKSPGMAWGEAWNGLGMRGNSSRNLKLDKVHVPSTHLLGDVGDQIWYLFEVVTPNFLMALAGSYLGLAQAALTAAIEHMQDRSYSHSGMTLGQVPVLQHRLGTLWAHLERARRLIYFAAKEGDEKGPQTLPAIFSAKAEIAECVTEIVNDVQTIMGGQAYAHDGQLGRLMRDARAAHVMSPTTDLLRTWTGRAILGLPILGD